MANDRKKRLEKLTQHRERELEACITKLSETRIAERAAHEQAEREREQLTRAEQERATALSRPLEAHSFAGATDFVVSCARRRELSEVVLARAHRAVQKAQVDVQRAQNDLKKIVLLTERLAAEERVRAERTEQRAADEFAAQRVESNRRRGEL